MGKPMIAFLICLSSAMASLAQAADVSVSMTLTSDRVTDGEAFQMDVTVEGSRSAGEPKIENASDFEIQKTGTSTRFQMVNGTVSSSVVYSYELMPKHPGSFKIGPASVTVSGKTYQSDPVEVVVAKASGGGTSGSGMAAGGGSAPSSSEGRSFLVKGEVDNKHPYAGQQIVYTFQLWNRARLQNAQVGLPDFGGFSKEQLEKQKDTERVVNGIDWHISELKYALFPLAPGKITIEPASLVGEVIVSDGRDSFPFDSFFNGGPFGFGGKVKRVKVQSDPLPITVQPLPSVGKPDNFAGLIGQFKVNTTLSRRELAVGDSVTLTVRVEGEGNVKDAKLPDLKVDGFKTYDDRPASETHIEGGKVSGSQTFKRALVPLKAGEFSLPPTKIAFFDPSSASYREAEAPGFNLKVSPGSSENPNYVAGDTTPRKNSEPQVEDIMPLKTVPSHWGSRPLSPAEQIAIWFLILGLPVGFAALYAGRRRWLATSGDRARGRRRQAYRNFSSRLEAVSGTSYHGEFSGLIREYLGDKGNFDGKALTAEDARRRLAQCGVSKPTTESVVKFLERCERSEYSGGMAESDRDGLRKEMVELVERLEKEMVR